MAAWLVVAEDAGGRKGDRVTVEADSADEARAQYVSLAGDSAFPVTSVELVADMGE